MKDADGNPIGKYDPNPILDTHAYGVQFPDGSLKSFNMNVIAENLYSQVDAEGNEYLSLKASLK